DVRQHQIEHDQRGRVDVRLAQRVGAGRDCPDGVAGVLEVERDERSDRALVFDDEDGRDARRHHGDFVVVVVVTVVVVVVVVDEDAAEAGATGAPNVASVESFASGTALPPFTAIVPYGSDPNGSTVPGSWLLDATTVPLPTAETSMSVPISSIEYLP